MTPTPRNRTGILDWIGFPIAFALAALLLIDSSTARDEAQIAELRRGLDTAKERVDNRPADAEASIAERLDRLSTLVENYAIGVERLSDRVARDRRRIPDPPDMLPAGNYRWRSAMRHTLEMQAERAWDAMSVDPSKTADAREAFVALKVMAGSYREYVTERVRKKVLSPEIGREKLDRIRQWEEATVSALLGTEGD
jgi:hypothetical protein